MINFFNVGSPDARIVDLPGYGYAQVPEAMKIKWQKELESYLVNRESLTGLVLLTDIRHPLKYFDEQMLHWAKDGNLAVHVLLTKADKLKRGAQKAALLATKKQLAALGLSFSIQLFSALKREGIEELADTLGMWLHLAKAKENQAASQAQENSPNANNLPNSENDTSAQHTQGGQHD